MAPINGTADPANAVPKKPLLVISFIAWTLHNESVMTTDAKKNLGQTSATEQLVRRTTSMSNRIVLLVMCLFLTSPLLYLYLSGKTFGREKSLDLDSDLAGCSEHKNFNDLFSQSNWNDWS